MLIDKRVLCLKTQLTYSMRLTFLLLVLPFIATLILRVFLF